LGPFAKAAIRKIPRRPDGSRSHLTPRDQLRVGLTFEDHPDRLVSCWHFAPLCHSATDPAEVAGIADERW
jgi:hypothetical protein